MELLLLIILSTAVYAGVVFFCAIISAVFGSGPTPITMILIVIIYFVFIAYNIYSAGCL